MKFIATEDARLHYEHLPRPGAPALLLMGALGTSLGMWDDQVAQLNERYELVRFEARGHGKSTLGSRQELTMERLALDALSVLDACGIARAHVCGLSIGGMVAMQIATQWPDRVLKTILCSTSAHMPSRENWEDRIATVTSQGMGPLVEPTLERWFTAEFRAAEPARVERIRHMLRDVDPRGYAACCAAIRDMDQRKTITAIKAKTLVIAGTRDPSTGPEQAQALVRSIPESKLALLEAAHLCNIERAGEFNEAVAEFLAA